MAELIAVWGSPNAGKTVFAMKLARYLSRKHSVYTVLADTVTPGLPVVFPKRKKEKLYSLGAALSAPDITREEIEAVTVTVDSMNHAGFLGYTDKENRRSYPVFNDHRIRQLLLLLMDMSDYVIVDCTSVPEQISAAAMQIASTTFRIVTPDVKSHTFCASQVPLLAELGIQADEQVVVLNHTGKWVFSPDEAAKAAFGTSSTLPFSREIAEASASGDLDEALHDRRFNRQFNRLMAVCHFQEQTSPKRKPFCFPRAKAKAEAPKK